MIITANIKEEEKKHYVDTGPKEDTSIGVTEFRLRLLKRFNTLIIRMWWWMLADVGWIFDFYLFQFYSDAIERASEQR